MKNEEIYRDLFIKNTIRLVAEGGFEKATTRAIVGDGKSGSIDRVNEAYIYRVFGTKENLFAETFAVLDDELIWAIYDGFAFFDHDGDFREQCEQLYLRLWRFLLQNEEKLRYYTRYYHSAYFKNDIYERHKKKYDPLVERIAPVFKPRADVWALLHHVISVLLSFAVSVCGRGLEDSEENRTHIFIVAYSSISPYIKSDSQFVS